jgi:hypothetical protein
MTAPLPLWSVWAGGSWTLVRARTAKRARATVANRLGITRPELAARITVRRALAGDIATYRHLADATTGPHKARDAALRKASP